MWGQDWFGSELKVDPVLGLVQPYRLNQQRKYATKSSNF